MLTDPIYLPLWIYMGLMASANFAILIANGVNDYARRKKEEISRGTLGKGETQTTNVFGAKNK